MSETVAAIVAAHRAGQQSPAQTVARSFRRIREHNDPAIFISLLEAYASIWVSPSQAVIVSFVVLILTLLFRPTGLFVPTPK